MPKPPLRISGPWPALLLCALGAVLPASAAGRENQAAVALLKNAIEEFSAGRPDQAASALERALRIEPNDAILWHYLGQTRLQQGHYQEAASLAAKSNTLIGDQDALRARNLWLIAAARQSAARTPPPSDTGSERQALQQRFDEESARRRQAEAELAALRAQLERAQCAASAPAAAPRESPSAATLAEAQAQSSTQIPASHWPPPGLCRIWFPDRPPGRQPPPGDCRTLKRQIPAGAWLVGS